MLVQLGYHIRAVSVLVLERVVELLKLFNSRTCQLVLGAGAIHMSGLKNVRAADAHGIRCHFSFLAVPVSRVLPTDSLPCPSALVAMQISARHLSLAAQALGLLGALLPSLRSTFMSILPHKQHALLADKCDSLAQVPLMTIFSLNTAIAVFRLIS